MKKLLLPLMAFLLIGMLLLAGCGGNTTTPAATTTTQTTTATTAQLRHHCHDYGHYYNDHGHTTATTTATTNATPTVDMYGGVYHFPLNVAPASPLGYPVETNNVEGMVASCALERLFNVGDGGVFYPRLANAGISMRRPKP